MHDNEYCYEDDNDFHAFEAFEQGQADMVTIEYLYGYSEQVPRDQAKAKIAESATWDVKDCPLHWEKSEQGEKATQAHPYFENERCFVGRIYS